MVNRQVPRMHRYRFIAISMVLYERTNQLHKTGSFSLLIWKSVPFFTRCHWASINLNFQCCACIWINKKMYCWRVPSVVKRGWQFMQFWWCHPTMGLLGIAIRIPSGVLSLVRVHCRGTRRLCRWQLKVLSNNLLIFFEVSVARKRS